MPAIFRVTVRFAIFRVTDPVELAAMKTGRPFFLHRQNLPLSKW
jgi:hypothetical protein